MCNKPQLLCSLCVIYIHIPVEQSVDSFPSTLSTNGKGTVASLDPCYLWSVQKLAKVSTLCTVSQKTPKLNLTDESMQQPQSVTLVVVIQALLFL